MSPREANVYQHCLERPCALVQFEPRSTSGRPDRSFPKKTEFADATDREIERAKEPQWTAGLLQRRLPAATRAPLEI